MSMMISNAVARWARSLFATSIIWRISVTHCLIALTTVMHPCLRLPDIQHAICAETYDPPDFQHRDTLLSLGLACKDLLHPALACLWADIRDTLPLIRLLPDELFQLVEEGVNEKEIGMNGSSSCMIPGCEQSGSQPHHHWSHYDETKRIPLYQLTRTMQPSDWDRLDMCAPFVKNMTLEYRNIPATNIFTVGALQQLADAVCS
ncbi:hypothetical protein BDV98DRAFT_39665 [Pterulicium gracile]|uniref:Uncharacterized protein n=1 Tax=Pterulicium gracile TaxID=1884261 RepID=A0A5C3R8P4_9AGAR|nr:hypothetical protein BDV98DRAFT_39665 [Pterula gracilis]